MLSLTRLLLADLLIFKYLLQEEIESYVFLLGGLRVRTVGFRIVGNYEANCFQQAE